MPAIRKMLSQLPVLRMLLCILCAATANDNSDVNTSLLHACAQDATIESLAGQFLGSGDLAYIGSGAKNSVIGMQSLPLVIRVAFVHAASCVLTGDIRPALQHVAFADPDSNLTRLASKSIELLRRKVRPAIDIMSSASLSDELFQSVLPSSVPSLVFGVNTAIARTQLCVSNSHLRVRNTKGTACELQTPLRLNIEFSRRFEGSVDSLAKRHLSSQPEFTGADLLVLAFGYVHDLGLMLAHHDWFPTDAHPGNLLYHRTESGVLSFVWHDFGRTSSESHIEKQVRRSIEQTIELLKDCLRHPLRAEPSSVSSTSSDINEHAVKQVVNVIRPPSPGEASHSYFSSMMADMDSAIHRELSADARTVFWQRIGSTSRYVVADMNMRLSELDNRTSYNQRLLEQKSQDQVAINALQKEENTRVVSKLHVQERQIQELIAINALKEEETARVSNELQELKARLEMLTPPTKSDSHAHALAVHDEL
jgi:hypothetical protein